MEGQSYALKESRGDQISCGEWYDLDDKDLRLYAMEIAKLTPIEKVRDEVPLTQAQPLDEAVKEAKEKAAEKNADMPTKLPGKKDEPER